MEDIMSKKINNYLHRAKDYFVMILNFAKNDLKKRYSGSLLGFLWAYIQPLVAILVFWFVFQIGLRNSDIDNAPFIAWLIPSYISWTFISDSILQSTNVLYEYSYLVKKVKFKIEILPLVKVSSSLIVHLFFILFAITIFLIYGYMPDVHWLQLFYYCFSATICLCGISWLVSSLSVFWKDVSQIVNVILQIGFWLCPIFWDPAKQNHIIGIILKCNPMYYITMGYRECFLATTVVENNIASSHWYFFYEHPFQTLYFWLFTLLICILGYFSFKKLKHHFPDLL